MEEINGLISELGDPFGVLVACTGDQITVVCRVSTIALGDLFLIPGRADPDRLYLFRATRYARPHQKEEDALTAHRLLVYPDSYVAENADDTILMDLPGTFLGYAQRSDAAKSWALCRPERLPLSFSDVYQLQPQSPHAARLIQILFQSQLGVGGLALGELLVGGEGMEGSTVSLPLEALGHCITVLGGTDSARELLLSRLLTSMDAHNRAVSHGETAAPAASALALSSLHLPTRFVLASFDAQGKASLGGGQGRLYLSRADLAADDLPAIEGLTDVHLMVATHLYEIYGESWIGRLLLGDIEIGDQLASAGPPLYLPGVLAGLQQRLRFLQHGTSRLFARFDPDRGHAYTSFLPDILCGLEQGQTLVFDPLWLAADEQILFTTIVFRALGTLRSALALAVSASDLPEGIHRAFGHNERFEQVGQRSLAEALIDCLERGDLPYIQAGSLRTLNSLPYVTFLLNRIPPWLLGNPSKASRHRIGGIILEPQNALIEAGQLGRMHTELVLGPCTAFDRQQALQLVSADLKVYEQELLIMEPGQLLLATAYKACPLSVQMK